MTEMVAMPWARGGDVREQDAADEPGCDEGLGVRLEWGDESRSYGGEEDTYGACGVLAGLPG